MKNILITALADNHIALSDKKIDDLINFLSLLNKWNQHYNLTAITDPTEQIYKHLIDSLSIAPFITGNHCLDVGSGAGFPGIPLAIALPDKHFTLIDSNQKKTHFLTQAKALLGLSNLTQLHVRTETLKPETPCDLSTARAFCADDQLIGLTQRLLAPDGCILAMKGEALEQKFTKISEDFQVTDVRQLSIVGLNAKRHVVMIKRGLCG